MSEKKSIGNTELITIERASKIFRLNDPNFRTLHNLFKKGLTKFDYSGFALFNEEELAKHIGVKNFNEPFLTIEEASVLLDVPIATLTTFMKRNLIPSYCLSENRRGSKILFFKSELDEANKKFFSDKLTKDGNYWDAQKRFENLQNLFDISSEFLFKKNFFTEREHEITRLIMCDLMPAEEVGEKFNLSRERIRQIFEKNMRRMRWGVTRALVESRNERKPIIDELRLLRSENKVLKAKLSADELAKLDLTAELEDPILSMKLKDMDLSVRSLNCLFAADIETFGQLVSYNKSDLFKFRNFGKKSLTELDELVRSKNFSFGYKKP